MHLVGAFLASWPCLGDTKALVDLLYPDDLHARWARDWAACPILQAAGRSLVMEIQVVEGRKGEA